MIISGVVRKHGADPFHVAVIHGGPGAPGSVAPLAQALSDACGILEPLQSADSLEGQVQELREQLDEYATLPVTLIGWSWGAWLTLILAARYPEMVRKLILVGSGPFEEKYAEGILETRMMRLTAGERTEALSLMDDLNDSGCQDKDQKLARFGALFGKTDTYAPLNLETSSNACQGDVYERVWRDASAFRKSGRLLDAEKDLRCPVVAIHGDYDPHPAKGVQEPLGTLLHDFQFILLSQCGHEPWAEQYAREHFLNILRRELAL